jgi:hypothetical protein
MLPVTVWMRGTFLPFLMAGFSAMVMESTEARIF